jgi:PBP1b-binding outer membrane lipoprotein LpoB
MKKQLTVLVAGILFLSACSLFTSLTSVTTIQPKQQFVLGNNEHGNFKVAVKNLSNQPVKIHFAPIDGGSHSSQTIMPNETVSLKVEKNTALVFANPSNDTVNVSLHVKGDLGLSMGYQNKQTP